MLHFMNARDSEDGRALPKIPKLRERGSAAGLLRILLPGSSVLLAARAGAPRPAYGFKA